MTSDTVITATAGFLLCAALLSCGETQTGTDESTQIPDSVYADLAADYARRAQAVLGQNLQTALAETGVSGALEFCHLEAIPLTDSLSTAYDTRISRVSDRPRNAKNHADAEEVIYIRDFQRQIDEGVPPHPLVVRGSDLISVYAPIVTNPLCLTCHGVVGKNISPADAETIDRLYPGDQAKNYGVNQVRGMWKINLEPKHTSMPRDL